MEKKTIGKFISVLRKSQGMTQQDVADRLNVSNKAVSRWERDECAPDISLIPAIAEMFGVSCDELLRGERISSAFVEISPSKSEKQISNYVFKTISKFKSSLFISLALAVVGLVFMFGISFGFYRPIIGFAVMIVFEIVSIVVTALAVTKAKDSRNDNELFEMAEDSLKNKFDKALGELSFRSFFAVFSSFIFALPIVFIRDYDYVESVIEISSYFFFFFWFLALILYSLYLKFIKPCSRWIVYGYFSFKDDSAIKVKNKMSVIQLPLVSLASLAFVIHPYSYKKDDSFFLPTFICVLGLAFIIANIVVFLIYLLKNKEKNIITVINGVRNVLLTVPTLMLSSSSNIYWYDYSSKTFVEWTVLDLYIIVILTVVILLVPSIIKSKIRNK